MAFNTVKKKSQVKMIVASPAIQDEGIAPAATDMSTLPGAVGNASSSSTNAPDSTSTPTVKMLLSVPLESDTLMVSSPYGYRTDPFTGKIRFHGGVDLLAQGDNVYALMPGRIRDVGYSRSLGNYVRIDHGDMTVTYGHLLTSVGRKGDEVKAGQSVGITGSTGRSTGEHLHVAVKYRGKAVDPLPILRYINDYVHRVRDYVPPAP